MAVLVLVCLVERMFLREDLLAFGWMGMERETREAGLMTGIWVVSSALKAHSSVWKILLGGS